jgi:hypothetical protein
MPLGLPSFKSGIINFRDVSKYTNEVTGPSNINRKAREHFVVIEQQIRNTWKVLKCGAGEG